MTTSGLELNEAKILYTDKIPMWRWILSYNTQGFRLFTIKRISKI